MAWITPKVWIGDELLTASDLNQYVSDNLAALYALAQGGGRKNLLHNGAMQVHQRGVSTSGITLSDYYTADRWRFGVNIGTWTNTVETDAPTGSGFRNSFKMLHTSAAPALVATSAAYVTHHVEGQNLQSVSKGTTSAQSLTLSFWTKSNKTGTYVVELLDDDNTRHVAATYTVVASGTWEQQTITFPADLTGAFDNDNDGSLILRFHLLAGTNFTSGTLATTWGAAADANRAVGQTNLAATTSNYWQVTGVQLEVGTTATGFEFKDHATELGECQRYYYRWTSAGTPYASAGQANIYSATVAQASGSFPVTMRTAASSTVDVSAVTHFQLSGVGAFGGGVTFAFINGKDTYSLDISGLSGKTAGYATMLQAANTTNAYLGFSADL